MMPFNPAVFFHANTIQRTCVAPVGFATTPYDQPAMFGLYIWLSLPAPVMEIAAEPLLASVTMVAAAPPATPVSRVRNAGSSSNSSINVA